MIIVYLWQEHSKSSNKTQLHFNVYRFSSFAVCACTNVRNSREISDLSTSPLVTTFYTNLVCRSIQIQFCMHIKYLNQLDYAINSMSIIEEQMRYKINLTSPCKNYSFENFAFHLHELLLCEVLNHWLLFFFVGRIEIGFKSYYYVR